MSFFSASHVTAGYGKRAVAEDISFDLEQGCLLGILGANGSGKTTLLKALCGILPHSGACELEGIRLETCSPRQIARLCSYIPQRSGISIDLSVLDVVLMGFNPNLGLLERPSAAMRRQALQALQQVGLAGKEEENYQTLSEGQKQLCILARTLCSGGKLLLLDEPESALDFRFRHSALELLHTWLAKQRGAAIVTLHDPMLALNACDQLLLLSEGTILGTLFPRSDSPEAMQTLLCRIYGPVSLTRCRSQSGKEQLVMLKEDGEWKA